MRERLEQTGAWWDDDVIALLPDRESDWAVSPEMVARDRAEAIARGETPPGDELEGPEES